MADKDNNKHPETAAGTSRDLLWRLFGMVIAAKKWWLIPFLIILAFLSIFVKLSGNSSVLPAIYALF